MKNKIKIIRKLLNSPHMWWLDIIIPLLLCTFMFSGLSFLIYSGQQHQQIASMTETKLLSLSLIYAGERKTKKKNEILIVNLPPKPANPQNANLMLEDYKELIKSLSKKGIKNIYIKPMLGASQEAYYNFKEEIKDITKDINLVFSALPRLIKSTPQEFRNSFKLLDSSSCKRANFSICSFKKEWNDWIHQNLAETFWKHYKSPPENFVSNNLPTLYLSYLLYLSSKEDFLYLTAEKALDESIQTLGYHTAFIGHYDDPPVKKIALWRNLLLIGAPLPSFFQKDTVSTFQFNKRISVVTSVDIWQNAKNPHITPHHIYWAQIAQMFLDDDLISISSNKFSIFLSFLFAVLIILSIIFLGTPISLGLFVLSTTLGAIINGLSIHWFHIYTPIFDSIFAGGSAFVFASFGKISYNAFQTWRFATQENLNSEITHLKDNFISLISHNLNTPVSKMQGMLDLLGHLSKKEKLKDDILLANHYVGKIQLSIKSVLVTTAIEEKNLQYEHLNLNHIANEYQTVMMPIVKRIGINAMIEYDKWDEFSMIPLRFNKRSLVTFLGALTGLNIKSTNQIKLFLQIKEADHENSSFGREFLEIQMSTHLISSNEIISHIKDPYYEEHPQENNQTVDKDVFLKLIRTFIRHHRGSIEFDANSKRLKLTLIPYQDMDEEQNSHNPLGAAKE